MKQRWFLCQHVLWALLVFRPFYYEWVSLSIFSAVVTAVFVVKHALEGFTIAAFMMATLFLTGILAQSTQVAALQYSVALVVGLLALFPLKVYWLPQSLHPVGLREDSIGNGLHYFEFYPLQEQQPVVYKSIKWNYTKEIAKMLEYKNISNRFIKKLGHFILSYADKYRIKIAQGAQRDTDKGIALSHGKGGTPFYYSSMMMHFASQGYRVGAVQHTQVNRINLKIKEQIKKFRGSEVLKRAEEFIETIKRLNTDKIVLLGHSYGCATAIQAYHSLDQSLKNRIQKIILLDPWFFPLEKAVFLKKIDKKILVLANQDFICNETIFQLNNQFIKSHEVEYIIWKDAHHLHQTDVGFINGNLLGVVKNSALSKEMLQLNIQAIDLFLKGKEVQQAFGQKNLGRVFKPVKFHREMFETW